MRKFFLFSLLAGLTIFTKAQISWTDQAFPYPASGYSRIPKVSLVDDNVIWGYLDNMTTKTFGFSKTQNGGISWGNFTEFVYGTSYDSVSDFQALSSNTAFLLLIKSDFTTGGLKKTTDGGNSWTDAGTFASFPDFVHFFDADNGIVVCDPVNSTSNFYIYKTSNGGNNWQLVQQTNLPPIVNDEYGITDQYDYYQDNFLFSTSSGRFFKTGNKGASWSAIQSPYTNAWNGPNSLGAFSWNNDNIAFIAGYTGGNFHKTTNGGTSWDLITNPGIATSINCYIRKVPNSNLLIATGNLSSKYSTDNGQTWTLIDSTAKYYLMATGQNSIWASGSDLKLYKLNTATLASIETKESIVNLYPNPVKDILHFTEDVSNIRITDVSGRTVKEIPAKGNSVNVSNLTKGIYMITAVTKSGEVVTKKIVKE